jgi:methylated-DNA-[protein]-cysteine S-methyltransferase
MTARSETTIEHTPIGPIHLAASAEGVTHVTFAAAGSKEGPPRGDGSAAAARIVSAARRQLAEYFAGQRQRFELPLAPEGTAFRRAVWQGLLQIPFGQTASYGAIARRIGRPRAVRAVGGATGKNPISIIVPCHRVIGSSGALTGFGGGLPKKRRLLALEGHALRGDRVL